MRVKAQSDTGTSASSNEVILVVGGPACTTAPGTPTGLASTVSGGTVTLAWSAPSGGCAPTSYVLQAASSSGSNNIANSSTGNVSTTYVATGVPAGTYYIRVRAQNASGQSTTSNEVTSTVGSPTGSPITITIGTNPVPHSGVPTTSAGCGGIADTWYYTQTIQTASVNPPGFDGSYRAVRTYSCTPSATCADNVALAGCSNDSFTFTVSNGIIQDRCLNFNPNISIPSTGSFSTLFYGFIRITGTWGTGTFTLQGSSSTSSGTYNVTLTITKTS